MFTKETEITISTRYLMGWGGGDAVSNRDVLRKSIQSYLELNSLDIYKTQITFQNGGKGKIRISGKYLDEAQEAVDCAFEDYAKFLDK